MDAHLRELRYFVATAEESTVTAAAARLFVSQPALSKQLRALERRLGFDLFERQSRGLVLTRQGSAMLPVVRELLAAWDRGYADVRALTQPHTLVVGMQTAVGRALQGPAVARFRSRFPGWTVSLRLVGWDDPTAGLADGTSDVAFVWLPVPLDDIATRVLVREPRWAALPAEHPLAAQAEISFADLADEAFVALPVAAGPLRDFWLGVDARPTPRLIAAEATAADEVLELVSAGVGIALIAEGNARLYQRPGLTFRPVPDLEPAELAVAWRRDDSRDAIHVLVDSIDPA
ncbi:DNA-binding transcriptional LysR family regulator [Kribbella aluminosa]|uniref:DNA-binding transcriptional LysR family regulator n=1 Tax=Kribbella aluminosa TaxID=416017 RepID=A0ABS4UIV8_9ACTN|nr:LysR substrate-binding domain-containing protein [Kribbella aluminosa]MBP2351491.1 DNA-binding transcriptional LysR family regulator [Kribbella aluminosa]